MQDVLLDVRVTPSYLVKERMLNVCMVLKLKALFWDVQLRVMVSSAPRYCWGDTRERINARRIKALRIIFYNTDLSNSVLIWLGGILT